MTHRCAGRCAGALRAAGLVCAVAMAVSLWGCTGSREAGDGGVAQTQQPSASGGVAGLGSSEDAEALRALKELDFIELTQGPAVLERGVSKFYRELGVIEFLDAYIIDMPPTAEFISGAALINGGIANRYFHADAGTEGGTQHLFENRLLQAANRAIRSVPPSEGVEVLHDAFFEALEECGRDSPWPDVVLFVLHSGRGYDARFDRVKPNPGLSYYEFSELRHECALYAVTYPTLDSAVRDELLAPQRAYFAKEVLDRLDNELPVVETPARYQAEVDELCRDGW